MTPKEYFKKEYGENHISYVVIAEDYDSLYKLIEEYANQFKKEVCKKQRELVASHNNFTKGTIGYISIIEVPEPE